MKRTDAQIYIIGHKPLDYGYWNNSLYTSIEAGAVFHTEHPCELRDDKYKVNFSDWNRYINEQSAAWWLWKHAPESLDYIGICQYRRRFEFPEDYDFKEDFEKYKLIVADPIHLTGSLFSQYSACHSYNDMEQLEKIIAERYPEYSESFDRYIKNNSEIYYSAGFITTRKVFNDYCKFLHSILKDFLSLNEIGFEDIEAFAQKGIDEGTRNRANGVQYQRAIGGFLAERIMTMYFKHNFKGEIKTMPYTKFENV